MYTKHLAVLKILLCCLLIGSVLVMASGCALKRVDANDESSDKKVSNENKSDAGSDKKSEKDSEKDDIGSDKDSATESPSAEDSSEVECVWTLSVDDTITAKVNGYNLECTVSLSASKDGGTDENGTYSGQVSLSYKYEMENQGIKGTATGSGQDNAVIFDVVAYDAGTYTDYGVVLKKGDLPPLPSLIDYDAMALGNFNLTGKGLAQESAGGADWSKQESKTVAVPFKLAINGGQVELQLPTLAPGASFKGMLTGTPK